MPLGSVTQEDWGGGIYRGRRAPGTAVYDAVNCLVDDEGQLFRRGGSAYYSASNGAQAYLGVYDAIVGAGRRTIMRSAQTLTALNGALNEVGLLTGTLASAGRPTGVGGWWILPLPPSGGGGVPAFYGGSLKANVNYTTGTVSVTAASATVTGAATAWLANVDAGMSLMVGATFQPTMGVVKSVDSDTQITLRDPWTGTTAAAQPYSLVPVAWTGSPVETALGAIKAEYAVAVGAPPRLVLTAGSRAYFTAPGNPFSINLTTDYHELQENAQIVGADVLGTSLILFTTVGVWAIANMELDPVDNFGNVQQQVALANRDVILWNDAGVAAWAGALLVPAMDDVFIFALDQPPRPITGGRFPGDGGIRSLYRAYVRAGQQPGLATVHRGHYFLPILDPGLNVIDVLVCRLDRGFAWTRWAGHAAGAGYTERVGSTTRSPTLLGVSGQRVTNLTDCFLSSGAATSDANGTAHTATIDTTDKDTGPGIRGSTVKDIRVKYELQGAGAITVSYSSGLEGASFTSLGAAVTGGGVSDGQDYSTWRVGKRRERIRVRIVQSGAASSFILRALELRIRPTGRA